MLLRHCIQSLLAAGLILAGLGCQRASPVSDRDETEKLDQSKSLETDRNERKAAFAAEVAGQMTEPLEFEFDFDVTDVAGNRLTTADTAGRVLMVNFCATWAPDCTREVPDLVLLHSRLHDQGLDIIAFYSESFDSVTDVDTNRVHDFCKLHQVPYSSAHLLTDVANQVPNFNSIPTKLFVDRKGKPRLMIAGVVDPLKLETIVESLLKESAD